MPKKTISPAVKYDQSPYIKIFQDYGIIKPGATSEEGICQVLSLMWLRCKLDELESGNRLPPEKRVALLNELMILLRAVEIQDRPNAPLNPRGVANTELGLKENPLGWLNIAPRAVATTVLNGEARRCYQYTFVCPKYSNGKHAVGIYLSSGKILGIGKHVYFFDCDEGEFKVAASSFAGWLPGYLKDNYGVPDDGSLADELVKYSLQ